MAVLFSATQVSYAQQVAQQGTSPEKSEADSGALNTVVANMEEAQLRNQANYRAYVMTREYRLYGGEEPDPSSEIIADVYFVPPRQKTFSIEKAEGNSRGEKIVRHVLEGEAKAASAGNAPGALTTANYNFKLLGEAVVEGQPCYVLQLNPKREERTLLRGKAYVDKNTFLVHRVEGEMSKLPSWWLKKVDLQLDFADADGMWLQTRTRAVADVRIFGTHVLSSEALKVQTANASAATFSPVTPDLTAVSARHAQTELGPSDVRNARARGRVPVYPVPAIVGSGVLVPH